MNNMLRLMILNMSLLSPMSCTKKGGSMSKQFVAAVFV